MNRAPWNLAVLLVTGALAAPAEARLLVDHVVVDGETKTSPRVLSARMSLRSGDLVNFEALARAERQLMESDLFETARVSVELSSEEAARRMYVDTAESVIDVHVAVTEKHSWFIVPFAGFGSGDYTGGLAYGDQNFAGLGLQVVAAGQLGHARSYLFAAVREPLVSGAPLTWAIAGLIRKERIRFYESHELVLEVPTLVGGGEAELGWVLSPHLRALVGFSARYQLVDPREVAAPAAPQPAYNPAEGRLFVLSFQARYDDTTAPDGLRRGVRLLLKNELSDRYWGSEFDYSKLEVRAELYGRLAWNYPSLLLDTVFAFPTSSRGVPVTEILRTGGSSLRGYLGNEFHGDTLLSLQAEDQAVVFRGLPLPFVDARFNIAFAVFLDAAALLERHPGGTSVDVPGPVRPKLFDFHTSVGAGVRIILPGVTLPAIKADVGYGIDVGSVAVTVSIAGGGS